MEIKERYRGSLLGLAAGDALGTSAEFGRPGGFKPLTTIRGGGPFGLKPGEWTDDTSMALCLAASLVETGRFDPHDQMRRYVRWVREGYMSSNGVCFDVGNTVRDALGRFERTGDAFSGSEDARSAGNGSLMRLAPAPLRFAADPREAVRLAGESSRTTHGAREAVDACRYYAGLILGSLLGASKDELLSGVYEPFPGAWDEAPLAPKVIEVAGGGFRHEEPPRLSGMGGYVIESLEVALWALHNSDDFRTGALIAVNVGFDADTYGAIYGQLAGALYGESGIPEEWRQILARQDIILSLADGLHDSARNSGDSAGLVTDSD